MSSTWMQNTNEVLRLGNLPEVSSSAIFNNDTTGLTKTQKAAKYKFRLGYKHCTLQVNTFVATRRFVMNLTAGTQSYVLDTAMTCESLRYHSWFNITPSTGGDSSYNGPLALRDYAWYMSLYANPANIQQGPPEFVVVQPYNAYQSDGVTPNTSLTSNVIVYPIPDQNYTLEYQAALNSYPLTADSSLVSWPDEYVHGLWVWAWKYLEKDLAEGRDDLDALVAQVIDRIKLMSVPATESKRGIRMFKMSTGCYRGWYRGGYLY